MCARLSPEMKAYIVLRNNSIKIKTYHHRVVKSFRMKETVARNACVRNLRVGSLKSNGIAYKTIRLGENGKMEKCDE